MRIDISFIPNDYQSQSLRMLSNKEVTNPYKRIDEIKNDKKALRRFYEERGNYLRLVFQLTKLEEELMLKNEQSLAAQCKEYMANLNKIL